MSRKTYAKSDKELNALIREVMGKHHPELKTAGVKVSTLLVEMDADDAEGAVLKEGGAPTLGRIKIQNIPARVLGGGDALLEIDLHGFEELEPEQRIALVDHQLQHLELKLDKHGAVREDSAGRPMMRIRPHDIQIGFFSGVAARQCAKLEGAVLETTLDAAVEIMRSTKRASAAQFQRRLKITPTQTAQLMEELHERGVLGDVEDGVENREIIDLDALRPANEEPAEQTGT